MIITEGNTKKNDYKYDFSIGTVEERSRFIEDKLGFIFNVEPHVLMGYSTNSMNPKYKYDRIPKLIDGYTTYFLKANDAGSSRKTEYSYYTCVRDEMRRKGNQVLYKESDSLDKLVGDDDSSFALGEILADDSSSMRNIEFGNENISTSTIKYAIEMGKLDKKMVKTVLSYSTDILFDSDDREIQDAMEQLIFNCYINAKDSIDENILEEYVKGHTLREISDKLGVGKSTVDRRLNAMLDWVGQK